MLSRATWRSILHTTSLFLTVLRMSVSRRCWPATTRLQLARQVLFTGVDGMRLTTMLGILAGVSVVSQTQLWLARFGQSDVLGSVLVAVLLREAGPLLVNLVVIGRSGTAMATELAGMTVRGELLVLEAQGLDPMSYLVLPRVIGCALSVFGLTVWLVAVSLGSGFLFGLLTGVARPDPIAFLNTLAAAVSPVDLVNFMVKTLIAGGIISVIACGEGLSVAGVVTEVPQAGTRAVVKSMSAVLLVSAIVSLFTYL